MFATFVANNSWPKADWVATTGPSTTHLSLLALSVTRYSQTKSTWQTKWATHMLKTNVFLVTSKLERLHAAIILQQKAIWGLTKKECTRKQLTPFLQNMHVFCVGGWWVTVVGAISSGLGSARIIFFAFDSHDHFNGELHFWGITPPTRPFIMAKNRQGG